MKFTTATLIAVGAGAASAYPNVVARDDWAAANPWQAPGPGDVRAPCPGMNTLANHGLLPRNGKGITVDMAVKAFKAGFNMGSDIITSAAGSAMSVCQQVTGKPCTAFDLDQLNTPHTFEHDASFSRQDFDFGEGNNHDFNQEVFNTVLEIWKDTEIIDYGHAEAARLQRIADCQAADKPGWFLNSESTQLTEMAFYLGTMGTPADGNARKDWVIYWWTHERFPFELGWNPTQRPEHNQSTINTMINNMLNAPMPKGFKVPAGSSTGSGSGSPVVLPPGYAIQTEASSIKIVPTVEPYNAKPCTLPQGWTYTKVGTSMEAYHPSSTPAGPGYGAKQTTPVKESSTAAKPSSTPAKETTTPKASSVTSVPVPTGHTVVANTTVKPVTTTFMSTSIAYQTTIVTVLKCASTITDCPAESKTPTAITKTVSEFTTICPVTATMHPEVSSSVMVKSSSAAAATTEKPAVSSTPAAATTETPVVTSYTVVSGNPIVISSGMPATTEASKMPNPYFVSVPAEVFPSVPAPIISQYHAATGAYAAPSIAPAYTQSGAAAISAATAPVVTMPQSTPAAAASTPAAAGGYGSTPSSMPAANGTTSSPPIATGGASAGKAISGSLAGLAVVAAMLL